MTSFDTSTENRLQRRGLAAIRPGLVASALVVAVAFATSVARDAGAQQPKKGAQAAVPVPAVPATGPVGVWIDHTGRGAVEITPCGPPPAPGTAPPPPETASLCGRIVWLQKATDDKGQPLRDILNKDATKRGGPICGLQIIGDVKPQRNGTWDNGWIYDPEQGSSFDVEIALRNPETLQVKGYLGVKFLSETFVWRRAKEPPPKCGA